MENFTVQNRTLLKLETLPQVNPISAELMGKRQVFKEGDFDNSFKGVQRFFGGISKVLKS